MRSDSPLVVQPLKVSAFGQLMGMLAGPVIGVFTYVRRIQVPPMSEGWLRSMDGNDWKYL